MLTEIVSNFTSHGKEEHGFYDNVEKIRLWQDEYKIPLHTKELFDELNCSGIARTYCPERAYYVAYVLASEKYDVDVTGKGVDNYFKEKI